MSELIPNSIVDNYRQRFINLNSNNINLFTKEAYDYFRVNVSKNFNPSRDKFLQSNYRKKLSTQSTQLIGKLYFFKYEAEEAGDRSLNVFDQYPMVFFFNFVRTKEGNGLLYGLNIHYLAPRYRQALLEKLLVTKSSNKINDNTRMKITWNIIKSLVNSKIAHKAIHAYRTDRFMSKLVEVPAPDWSIAVFLRLEKFVHLGDNKISHSSVRKRINKGL